MHIKRCMHCSKAASRPHLQHDGKACLNPMFASRSWLARGCTFLSQRTAVPAQATCKRARSPVSDQIRQLGNWSNLLDDSPPAASTASSGCSFTPDRRTDSTTLQRAAPFTDLQLSVWRRVYTGSDSVDDALIAACMLIAAVAAGAGISRAVRWRRGRQLTHSALVRELQYHSFFSVNWLRWVGRVRAFDCGCLAVRCCRKAKRSVAGEARPSDVVGDGAAAKLSKRVWALITCAVVVWAAVEVGLIVLVLPATSDITFPHAVEHVVVQNVTNFGPRGATGCRSIEWAARGGLEVAPRLEIQRCVTTQTRPAAVQLPGETRALSSGGQDNSTEVLISYSAQLGQVVAVEATERENGLEAAIFTTAFRRGGSGGRGLPLPARLASADLVPPVEGALARTDGACALASKDVYSCTTDNLAGDDGDRVLTQRWRLACPRNDSAGISASVTAFAAVLMERVDLQIAGKQTAQGFAASVHQRPGANTAPEQRQQHEALLASVTGSNNVVASVTTPRINLLGALLFAIAGVVLYTLAQLRDKSAVHAALHMCTIAPADAPSDHPNASGGNGHSAEPGSAAAAAPDAHKFDLVHLRPPPAPPPCAQVRVHAAHGMPGPVHAHVAAPPPWQPMAPAPAPAAAADAAAAQLRFNTMPAAPGAAPSIATNPAHDAWPCVAGNIDAWRAQSVWRSTDPTVPHDAAALPADGGLQRVQSLAGGDVVAQRWHAAVL